MEGDDSGNIIITIIVMMMIIIMVKGVVVIPIPEGSWEIKKESPVETIIRGKKNKKERKEKNEKGREEKISIQTFPNIPFVSAYFSLFYCYCLLLLLLLLIQTHKHAPSDCFSTVNTHGFDHTTSVQSSEEEGGGVFLLPFILPFRFLFISFSFFFLFLPFFTS